MKRLFALDLSMRSTACNYDPCIVSDKSGKPKVLCDDCKVTFISDRFLGEDFQRKIIGRAIPKGSQKFTYVIIVDAVGCNLDCWFCYAWKFLKKSVADEKCLTSFVSPEKLAEQFFCKFKKVCSLEHMIEEIKKKDFQSEKRRNQSIKHIKLNLPLSRIRISGGEPIFSNNEVLIDREKEEPVHLASVEYWLRFFERLDGLVGKLKKDRIIHLVDVDKWDGTSPHLSCLSEVTGKLNVRFDTNGILFGNEKITEAFIGGLHGLYKKDKLNHLFIQIDYSIKGATPTEYHWSQSRSLPVSAETNSRSFSLEEHPQYRGYKNINDAINRHAGEDVVFRDCIDITVEKGIDHDERSNTFLYSPDAMNWDNFSEITGIKFSPVINCFDLNFGWRTGAKMYRYSNRGAVIQMATEKDSVDTLKNTMDELFAFRSANVHEPSFRTVVYPTGKPVKLQRLRKPKREPSQTTLLDYGPAPGWILTGNVENWKVALDKNVWGVTPKLRPLWEQMRGGDLLFFYATKPVSGIIGVAKVQETMKEDVPLWPNEVRQGKVKYPYRIRFRNVQTLKKNDWRTGRLLIRHLNIVYYRGANAVRNGETLKKLADLVEKAFRKDN